MGMVFSLLLLVLGFVLLVKGADRFVDGASDIAGRLGISQLVIGLTIVAMGTSAPEAAVSITAAVKGNADITIGNIVGSNILNILIILGLASVVAPLAVSTHTLFRDIPFMIAITMLLLFQGSGGNVGFGEGTVLTLLFLGYTGCLLWMSKKESLQNGGGLAPEQKGTARKGRLWQPLLNTLAGLAMIVLGSQLAVGAATDLARLFGMSERFIGLTIVALGTSLPELVTAITSLIKGHGALSLGNVIGANLFNLVLVSGVSVTLAPFSIPQAAEIGGINASLVLDLPVMFLVMALLTLPALARGKLSRLQGLALLAIYAAFCVVQFTL